jgi:flagellar motor switch protein FliN
MRPARLQQEWNPMPDESKPDASEGLEALLKEAQSTAAQTAAATGDAASGGQVAPDKIAALLDQAQDALSELNQPAPLPPGVKAFEFQDLSGTAPANGAASLDLLRDVQLDLKIELGRTHMQLEDVLRLKHGAVVTLDKLAGDPVDIYANGRLIARGEVLVLNDNFCVRVAELITTEAAAS